ncbi:MAG: IS1182 family transposase [Acidimicrobiaceae bacterium]|nr:IS1182 family transposase [Acidimicrobiaceae bacterium]MXZ98595.1 IS1182 family transposase [Acidimicrobiaceae bacterium]MYE75728.1 IS1182 family transposase [Acidimicrobiaceae bacterium]MYE98283.1 IS1182 family transposase [Acidimicrobiaceae bacterium]MYI54668.1 IS1182 family transposase [Acidimicrobiaceae bacterium]
MQGTEGPDRELLDALGLCGALVREGSVCRFLAGNRLRLFPDEMFGDLFGPLGRPSQPASVVAAVLVLQALEGCSDREAAERLRCDVRWKAAAGLAVDDEGFHCSVLSLCRSRLRAGARPERIFDAVRELAAECGALSRSRRRALGSTVLDDAVAAQDTVTVVSSQIRRVRRLVGAAAALELAHDYDGRAKPACDWSDADERAWLVDDLVTDALAVLDAVEGLDLTDDQAEAAGLLGVVAGQDVEADPKVPGRWRIARRVAPGRVVSTVDPEARHAHKTRSQHRDGYKAHIVAEPDTGIVTAVELTAADASDAEDGARLLDSDPTCHTGGGGHTDPTCHTDGGGDGGWLVSADSAYASGEALESFTDAGWDTAIKPIERGPHIAGGFTRDDFAIDADAQTVTCPAGHTKAVTSGAARFGKLCAACPLRARCTTSPRGRSVTVDAHEPHRQANKARWRRPATKAAYRRHRPMAERPIAWLTRAKARRVPYRGVAANNLRLTHRAAAVNLVRLANLGAAHNGDRFALPVAA